VIKKFFKKTKINSEAGFSILEMLAVLGIFAVITAIVSFNYGKFNNQIVLTNLAYEVAMQIREAQVFSFGVRGAGGTFDSKYGVYFNTANGNSFYSFVDKASFDGICGDCLTCPGGGECQKVITLPRNMKIHRVINAASTDLNPVSISFNRPNPDALIRQSGTSIDQSIVNIVIRSPDAQYKKIVVRQNGYISVEDYNE
jgi:prepilin-type N-terminal cleavage/methylation domain-containing protein